MVHWPDDTWHHDVVHDMFERLCYLCYVENVPHLCKVWRDILASGQCKELVKLSEGLYKLQRGKE